MSVYLEQFTFCRNTKPTLDPTGRFHIGTSFVQAKAASATLDNRVGTSAAADVQPTAAAADDPEKYCKVCEISVTSGPQMKAHLSGTKHAKKLKLLGEPPYASKSDTILKSLESRKGGDVVASPLSHNKRDNSIYRTPSGSYYCKPCDVTITLEVVFNQHLDSKKHIKTMKTVDH